jgi:DNA repair photolyase
LNDPHIPQLLKRAKDCGASYAFINLLRLPGSVAPYFEQRLREQMPDRADRVLNRLREVRGGRLNVSEFGKRMTGEGEYWKMIEQSFRLHARRLGFNQPADSERFEPRHTFRRPTAQASLFD